MATQRSRIILGTRGSDLALTQTRQVAAQLKALRVADEVVIEIIATTGDKRQDLSLSAPDLDKAVFTKELEDALADGSIDAAVHSLKDVPTALEDQFALAATLERAPVEDVLITKAPEHAADGVWSLPEGATVATSSVRRHYQLRMLRPDLNIVEIRGNVPTRLIKVCQNEGLDATILAHAGLLRLGYDVSGSSLEFRDHRPGCHVLDPTEFIPAAGQGAIAIEIRSDDTEVRGLVGKLNHLPTWQRIRMERAFLDRIGAGCQTPVGLYTETLDQGQRMRVMGIVFNEETEQHLSGTVEGDAADSAGLANQLHSSIHG